MLQKFGLVLTFFILALGFKALADATTEIPPILDATAIKDGADGRPNVDPCDNFYQFACGEWLDKTQIPADKTGVSRQVTAAMDATDVTLNKILAAYARGDFSIPSTYAGKLSDLYQSCMDVDKQTARSVQFIKKEILNIKAATSDQEIAKEIAKLDLLGVPTLFYFRSSQDLNDSTKVIGDLSQGGMSFESKDYYFNKDKKSVEIRTKFVEHAAQLFVLLGEKPSVAKLHAKSVLKFETALAKNAYSLEDANDPSKINHSSSVTEVEKLSPSFDWQAYFKTLAAPNTEHINVEEPEFFAGLSKVLKATSRNDLNVYLVYHLIDGSASLMGGKFEAESFAFWDQYMSGAKSPQAPWKKCTGAVESSMGYALAEAYIKTFDGDEIKRRTEAMISNIKQTFLDDLEQLNKGPDAWIDDQTVKGAVEKVNVIAQKVGAPDKFLDYSSVKTTSKNYLENILRIQMFETKRDLAKIGKPVDKTEWGMMPWEINAYYDRSNNEFVFPFGILQPPSLDFKWSDGANYGSFGGGTIGHELTHGFDNNGSKYDAHGNLKNWWTEETGKKFAAKAQCYIDQANNYKIEQVGMNVNGGLTLEENLADQGGVKLGYLALDKILGSRPQSQPWQGRYSERQQYWLGYAQSWCTKQTDERLRKQMATNEHPPAEFRVNGVIMNRPEFARDFNCKAGAKMNPAQKCSIW